MTRPGGLRVALATPSYPPGLGGLANLVEFLAIALVNLGCETTVLTQFSEDDSPPPLSSHEGMPRVLAFPNRIGGRRFGYAPGLRRYLRAHRDEFDVVHAFNFHAPVALAVANATDSPFFFSPCFHAGGHSVLANVAHLPYRPIAARIFNRADSILCFSHAERNSVIMQYPFCADWAKVVVPAIDEHRYDGIAPFEVDRQIVLSAGRLDAYKRVDLIIEAMRAVNHGATLVICGAGPDEPRLRRLIDDCGVKQRTWFLGAISDTDVRRWQRTASVTVTLSTRESFGLSFVEAAVAGSAIVASDIPAHRETAEMMRTTPTFLSTSATHHEVANAVAEALASEAPTSREGTLREWSDVAVATITEYEAAIAHSRRLATRIPSSASASPVQ